MSSFPIRQGFIRHFAVGSFTLALILVFSVSHVPWAQMRHHGMGHGMHQHRADGTGHDEINMPGLRGLNASAEESAEIALLFRKVETLSRNVTNLPNGIRTETSSTDDAVREALISHVAGMIARVETGDEP